MGGVCKWVRPVGPNEPWAQQVVVVEQIRRRGSVASEPTALPTWSEQIPFFLSLPHFLSFFAVSRPEGISFAGPLGPAGKAGIMGISPSGRLPMHSPFGAKKKYPLWQNYSAQKCCLGSKSQFLCEIMLLGFQLYFLMNSRSLGSISIFLCDLFCCLGSLNHF